MPFQKVSIMEQRQEFVILASKDGVNVRALCRRFQISPTTAYKWLDRFKTHGLTGLQDHSRRPAQSPLRTADAVEAQVVTARQAHPKWGARKLKRWVENREGQTLPSVSTVHMILQRHGCIDAADRAAHRAWHRFEHPLPNDLWQMDFKGHFAVGKRRCHPLTVLDDPSRYVVCLGAQGGEQFTPTQARLMETFRRYGLPWRMTMDNGAPWGEPGRYTRFEVWLMRLGDPGIAFAPLPPANPG